MKRLLSALISAVLLGAVLAFAACNAPSPDTPAPAALPETQKLAAPATKPQQEESAPATDSPSDLPEESANGQPAEGSVRIWRLKAEGFVQRVHPAPWLDKTKTPYVFAAAANRNILELADTSSHHLPAYKAGSVNELAALAAEAAPLPVAGSYDDAFFEDYGLVFVYVHASSGSFRFRMSELNCWDGQMLATVENQSLSEGQKVFTDDIAAWLLVAEVPRRLYDGVTLFDAAMADGQWN